MSYVLGIIRVPADHTSVYTGISIKLMHFALTLALENAVAGPRKREILESLMFFLNFLDQTRALSKPESGPPISVPSEPD
ncbi:hypothetical protein EDB86DRAFT_3099249 [Lactarius hatsudake]|nr:hypothetical protein EDB86DRAFT_3099249 [Lactarius hatsudake]